MKKTSEQLITEQVTKQVISKMDIDKLVKAVGPKIEAAFAATLIDAAEGYFYDLVRDAFYTKEVRAMVADKVKKVFK